MTTKASHALFFLVCPSPNFFFFVSRIVPSSSHDPSTEQKKNRRHHFAFATQDQKKTPQTKFFDSPGTTRNETGQLQTKMKNASCLISRPSASMAF